MTNWLRQKFKNFLYPEDEQECVKIDNRLTVTSADEYNEDNTLRFSVTPARGGIIVSVRNYNRKKDASENTVHVIHDDEDVAHRVSEIVSLSLLRN
jgi:hypothetical protein